MNKVTISEDAFRIYKKVYPNIKPSALRKKLKKIKKRAGRLDAITVEYYMKPYKRLGKVIRK